jgi:hypothetical protein
MTLRRREFISLIGGAAAWPLAASAQQGDRVRRIGVLLPYDENDPEGKRRYSAFTQALADLGWSAGRNVRSDLRWAGTDNNRIRALAQELVGLQPDIILTGLTPPTVAVQRETRTIPIIFVSVAEPVASGIVARLDRPSGNITGSSERGLRRKPGAAGRQRYRFRYRRIRLGGLEVDDHLKFCRQLNGQIPGHPAAGRDWFRYGAVICARGCTYR